MAKRFGLMVDRSDEMKAVPGTCVYTTLLAAMQVAEYVRVEQGLTDVAIYDYETNRFI